MGKTSWNPPYGERSAIPDRFNGETLTLSHAGQGSLTVKLEFRAYHEGVALRYLLGERMPRDRGIAGDPA